MGGISVGYLVMEMVVRLLEQLLRGKSADILLPMLQLAKLAVLGCKGHHGKDLSFRQRGAASTAAAERAACPDLVC